MERFYETTVLVASALSVLFLVACMLCLCGCVSEAERYMQVRYPSCEVSTLEETGWHAILEITCPGEKPFTKKVRNK